MRNAVSILLTMILVLSLFAGCAQKAEPEASPSPEASTPNESASEEKGSIKLATLKGATTMGLVKLLDDASKQELTYDVDNTIYGSPDEITALLVNGDIDAAAIPCNLASVLYNKTQGKIQVAAINTLGVLSVIELGDSIQSISDLAGKTVYSTGKGTTPEYVFNAILSKNGIDPTTGLTVEYKSESTEIAAFLTGETAKPGTIAVLPQPYATTVLMSNPEARIALDLTKEWETSGLEGSLVTGVLVVRRDFAENSKELLESFLSDYENSAVWANDNNEEAAKLIADAGIVPKAEVAVRALPYCNITFKKGEEMKSDVSAYLDVLYRQNPKAVGGTLPADDFYYAS